MIPDQIEREIVIAAPPERVWAAITEAKHLGAWFADSGAEVDLRPGGAMILRWRDHGESRAAIERVEPGRYLSWRWSDAQGADPREGHATLVEFTLTPEADGTRVRVVESGILALAKSEERKAAHARENGQGWTEELAELRGYLERRAA